MGSISSSVESYELMEGLGDCLIAGGAIQYKAVSENKKIGYATSKKLHFLLDTHPNIELVDTGTKLLWPSQFKETNLFPLHTSQRFSKQLGYYIDPTYTLDLYIKGTKLVNIPSANTICINTHSAEYTRRYIKEETISAIEEFCNQYSINLVFIGNSNINSITNIEGIVSLLLNCKLFIGPVSFCYHLAESLKVRCMLLGNYMPTYKFSNFKNTISIDSKLTCIRQCEQHEKITRDMMNCWNGCKAHPETAEVINQLQKLYDKNFV